MPHIHEKIDFVVVAYIVYKQKVLLVLHKKLKEWLPIGGHIELDEDPEEALFREIKEECGLDVEIIGKKPEQQFSRRTFLYSPRHLDIHDVILGHKHVGLTYFAKAKSDKVKLSESEHDNIRWFTKQELDDKKYNLSSDIKFYALAALNEIK